MKSYNIAVIGGDGTGPEVVREAIKVLDVAAKKFKLKLNYTNYDLGGDRYLRMLLTHEARSVLRAASAARELGGSLDGLRTWATAVRGRTNHNKAACAPANKMARICYATLRDATPYGQPSPRQQRKIERLAFAVAA